MPDPTVEERLDALERTVFFFIEQLTDVLHTTHLRTLALQETLETKAVVAASEVNAVMRAFNDTATLEQEYSDDPVAVQYRKLRRFVEEKLREQHEQSNPHTEEEEPS